MIMPSRLLLDAAGGTKLGELRIGQGTEHSIGPGLRRQGSHLGIRMQDLLKQEEILGKKITAALDPGRLGLRPYVGTRRWTCSRMTKALLPRLRPPPRRPHHRRRADDLGRARRRRTSSVPRARGARSWTSTGEGRPPFVSLLQPDRRRGVRRARAWARRTSARWGTWPRRTSHTAWGKRTISDELDDEVCKEIRRRGGELEHDDEGAAGGQAAPLDIPALRCASRSRRRHRRERSRSSTSLRASRGRRSAPPTAVADDAAFTDFPYHPWVAGATPRAGTVELMAANGRTSPGAARRPICRRPRATTWTSSPRRSTCRSCSSASARAASRSSGCRTRRSSR